MTVSFSSEGMRPCSKPTLKSASRLPFNFLYIEMAAFSSFSSFSSITGYTM